MEDNEIIRKFNENATEHQSIMEKLEKFGEKLEDVKISIAELPKHLTDEFDKRYANKETETSVKRVTWIVITAVIGALMVMVLK